MTKEEQEKKNKRNQFIIGIILILVMILSTAGYAITSGDKVENDKIKYNGIDFVQKDGYWYFDKDGQQFATVYNPIETENISVSFFAPGWIDYSDKPLYFVGNFQEPNYEIKRNMYNLVLRIADACLIGENCTQDLPLKNCLEDNVIIIQEPEKEEGETIKKNEKCVFIRADIQNQTRYADAFLFKILGIRNE